MKMLAAFALVVSLLVSGGALPAQEPDLVGIYRFQGIGAAGDPYGGAAEITREGPLYRIVWHFDSGSEPEAWGLGFVEAGVFVVTIDFSGVPGLAGYAISEGGLTGHWIMPMVLTPASETLTKTPHKQLRHALRPKGRAV